MIVKVTQDHIDKGQRHRTNCCPIALAIRELCPGQDITVNYQHICKWDGNTRIKGWEMPYDAGNFAADFDAGAAVQPFEFEWEEN